MFGVTTAGGARVRAALEALGYEVVVFHANGVGGATMEELIGQGCFAGVVDWTITELADELVGGIRSAGPRRLEAAGARGLPQVVVPGAIDVVNFGPRETVPARYAGRRLHAHTPSTTLLRTSADESAALGRLVAAKLNRATGPVVVLAPLGGFSALDAPGGPFEDPAADVAFAEALRAGLRPGIVLRELPEHINSEPFVRAVVEAALSVCPAPRREENASETVEGAKRCHLSGCSPGPRSGSGSGAVRAGRPILAAGCSVGLVAKCAELGGADLLIVYSTGRSRIMGLPTTPIGHSNAITLAMYDEIANVVNDTPIIGGVEAIDPTYLSLPRLIARFRQTGFSGLINFPTIGNNPGRSAMREDVGLGFSREVEMVRLARSQTTSPWPTSSMSSRRDRWPPRASTSRWRTSAGRPEGLAGATESALTPAAAAERVQAMIEATLHEQPECHLPGARRAVRDARRTRATSTRTTDAVGFVGASSIERIPIERAVRRRWRRSRRSSCAAVTGSAPRPAARSSVNVGNPSPGRHVSFSRRRNRLKAGPDGEVGMLRRRGGRRPSPPGCALSDRRRAVPSLAPRPGPNRKRSGRERRRHAELPQHPLYLPAGFWGTRARLGIGGARGRRHGPAPPPASRTASCWWPMATRPGR